MISRIIFLALISYAASQTNINTNVLNSNVERTVDLTSQLTKVTATITLENAGKDVVKSFLVFLEPDLQGNLSYISVKDSLKDELKVIPVKVAKHEGNKNTFNVQLNQAVNAGRTATVTLEYVLADATLPHPAAITQKEKQLVRYFGNHYFYSPYTTKKQSTTVTLSSRNIESYSKLKPTSQSDTTINYGPYENVAPLSLDVMTVHFESNAPFLKVTRLERLIEISHWGNIAVQENIEILHTGAKLKGPFSRYDYQRETNANHYSVKAYRTILPASAHSIYYRDSNGNISTSQVRYRKDWIELELRPRFPLFGGWKSSYTIGYGVPSYQYLFKGPGKQNVLHMRLIDHVFDDMHVEELETSIVLPVGVKNVKVNLPYEVERLPDGVTYKYLDTLGRQVINFRKKSLVEQHIQDVEITYEWEPLLFLHEPLLVSGAIYLLFIAVIIYVRLDFSISKPEHVKTQ